MGTTLAPRSTSTEIRAPGESWFASEAASLAEPIATADRADDVAGAQPGGAEDGVVALQAGRADR